MMVYRAPMPHSQYNSDYQEKPADSRQESRTYPTDTSDSFTMSMFDWGGSNDTASSSSDYGSSLDFGSSDSSTGFSDGFGGGDFSGGGAGDSW
ncbi:hypothetical protein ACLI1A_10105 [Flavobacterium sp. RHBU_3]|uniref:hypothetical protein n=1 Tax=Flavobacterium sp. RHBU_3 TaxID=3391184 RepID=UPI00398545E3